MRLVARFALAGGAILLAATSARGQEVPFLSEAEYNALAGEVSGDLAYEHIRFMTQFHRPRGGAEGLMAVAQYVEAKAKEYGLEDVRLLRQPYGTPAWNARRAELWMVEPERALLAAMHQVQLHLADQSRPADVTADVVDVGAGADSADYVGKDVQGKIVLAYGSAAAVVRRAVWERGALGLILRPDPTAAQAIDHPDQVRWTSVPVASPQGNAATFAFVLSHRQGVALARRLAAGPVKVRAIVESELDPEDRWQVMVEARIRGADVEGQDLVLTGHLQEEKFSANDDASGSANTLEVARALMRLVREGNLPRPRRTIRFWWVTEISSERQYFADHPEEAGAIWLNINQDMVGANQGQDLLRVQNVTRLPWARAHVLEAVAEEVIGFLVRSNTASLPGQQAGSAAPYPRAVLSHLGTRHRYNATLVPFHLNTDHMTFLEAPIGRPGITFTNWPDDYIHTSDDDLWNIDRTQLQRNALAAATIAYVLARASDRDVPPLLAAASRGARARLAEAYGLATRWAASAPAGELGTAYARARDQIAVAAAVGAAEVRSVSDVAGTEGSRRAVTLEAERVAAEGKARLDDLARFTRDVRRRTPGLPALPPVEKRLAQMRPALVGGPKEWQEKRGSIEAVRGLHFLMAFEILNAIDGARTALDIYRLVSAEARAAGAYYYGSVTPEAVEVYLKNAEKAGIVRTR